MLIRRIYLAKYIFEVGSTNGEVTFIVMLLELKTLLVCLFMGHFFMVVLIVVYRSYYETREGTSSLFVTAKCLQLAVLIILILRNLIDSPLIILVSALLVLFAAALDIIALLRLLGVDSHRVKRYYYLVVGSATAYLILNYSIYHEVRFIIAFTSLAGVLIAVYPVYILCVELKRTGLQKIIGLLYSIVILSLVGRALEPLYSYIGLSTQASAVLLHFFYLGIYLQMFLGTAGFMLLSREATYTELERVATYDELTGIMNRRSFVKRAQPLIAISAVTRQPFSFLLLDVDHFKNVNDTHGHNNGDRVLKDLALRIQRELRSDDLFARFGGEEFAVLLANTDENMSDEIAERMRKAVMDTTIEGTPIPYTISIGVITTSSGERTTLNALYKRSDIALYEAKQKGRNCVVRSYGQPTQSTSMLHP